MNIHISNTVGILLADDKGELLQTVGKYLKASDRCVYRACDSSLLLWLIKSNDYDIALIDDQIPGMENFSLLRQIHEIRPYLSVIVAMSSVNANTTMDALKFGAADVLRKPVQQYELNAALEKAIRIRKLRQENARLRESVQLFQNVKTDDTVNEHDFIGVSPVADNLREQIRRLVSGGADTILITGETGTGKEMIAREIHRQSGADKKPFIAVSCPVLSESNFEHEMFGYVTDGLNGIITSKAGYFELADSGTLFLDEIGELPLYAQAKLLRVLESRTFRHMDDNCEISVSARVIATTNVALEKRISAGRFRKDLFYRLNTHFIHLPPLRERREDILPLARHFLSLYIRRNGLKFKGFSRNAEKILMQYHFPGNVRELRNVVERATIFCDDECIQLNHLIFQKYIPPSIPLARLKTANGDQERAFILNALETSRWNRRQAAKILNMPYSTLRYKIRKLKLA